MTRTVMLNGTPIEADVLQAGTVVGTPWGPVQCQVGDVLVPWGTTAAPIPQRLLDALLGPEEKDEEKDEESAKESEPVRPQQHLPPNLPWHDLRRFAARNLPNDIKWQDMKRPILLKTLEQYGFGPEHEPASEPEPVYLGPK